MSESRVIGQLEAELKNLKEEVREIKMRQKELEAWKIEQTQKAALAEVAGDGGLAVISAGGPPAKKERGMAAKLEMVKQVLIIIALSATALGGVATLAKSFNASGNISKDELVAAIKDASKNVAAVNQNLPAPPSTPDPAKTVNKIANP